MPASQPKYITKIWCQISYGNTALPLASDILKTFKPHIGDLDAKNLKNHIGEPRTREWWTPRIKKTSQQEILKRKKQQKHPKLETDDFPRGTKKKNEKTKKKQTNEKQQQKKKPAKHWKFFKSSRRPNFWETKWT